MPQPGDFHDCAARSVTPDAIRSISSLSPRSLTANGSVVRGFPAGAITGITGQNDGFAGGSAASVVIVKWKRVDNERIWSHLM